MENLFTLLFFLFVTLALLVFILGRFAKPMSELQIIFDKLDSALNEK